MPDRHPQCAVIVAVGDGGREVKAGYFDPADGLAHRQGGRRCWRRVRFI
jgi:hypothetical protein